MMKSVQDSESSLEGKIQFGDAKLYERWDKKDHAFACDLFFLLVLEHQSTNGICSSS
jgi:hypothetical protein